MKKENKQKEESYDTWRANKVEEIRAAFECSLSEAAIIFLLQDISFKLSKYYKK